MSPKSFRQWADLMPEPLLLLSGEGVLLAANAAADRHLGADFSAAVNRPLRDIVEQSSEQMAAYLRACSRSRQPVFGALTLRADGEAGAAFRCSGALLEPAADAASRRLLLRLSPKEQANTQFIALRDKVSQLTVEVGRRRRVESQLRDERERLHTTLQSIGDAVMATDQHGRVTDMNPVAECLTGWSDEAIGQPLTTVFRIVNEYTGEAVENPVDRVLNEGVVVGLANHTVLIAKDGVRRPIADSAAPIRDEAGRITGVVLIFRDASTEREAQEAIRESQFRLQLALGAGRMGVWDWDVLSGVVTWSPTLEAIHGLEVGAFPGTFEAYQRDIHPDDRERVLGAIQRAVEHGGEHHIEYRILPPGGGLKWLQSHGQVFRDEEGRPVRMLGVCADITSRKRAEQRLREEALTVETLHRVGSAVAAELDLETVVNLVTRESTALTRAEFGAFFYNVVEGKDESYTLYAFAGEGRETFENFPMPRNTPVFEPTFRGEAVVRSDDITRDPRYGQNAPHRGVPPGHLTVRSYLAAPVVSRSGEVLGGLFFGHSKPGVFGEREERLAVGLAAQAAVAIDNAQLYRLTQESERKFRQLADAMPQVVWTARPDGYLDYFNARWYERFSHSDAPGGDESWAATVHPADLQRTLDRWYESVRAGEPYQIEYRFKDRLTNTYRWHLGRALPVRDDAGKIVAWFGTSTDIDDQKRAEQASQFLADASSELARLTDSDSTLQRIAGLAVPEFADWCVIDVLTEEGSLRRLAVAHVDPEKTEVANRLQERYPANPNSQRGAAAVVRGGRSQLVAEITEPMLREVARDEEHLALLQSLGLRSYMCVPLKIRDKVFGVLSFVASDSGRRYSESDLSVAEDLAQRAAVAIENNRLYDELRDADRRKDEFLAMLAHELRNPLAPIRSGLDLLALQGVDEETVQIMQQQVVHLVRLVDDLLDVSRILRGKIELRREPIELAEVVRRAVDTVRPIIDAERHQLDLELSTERLLVHGDPVRLSQVITNLLNNAAKYTDRGGRIQLRLERRDDRAVLRVSDTGVGISSDLLPHVFDLFTQADQSLDRSRGGLGIGLTLVRRLVEMHSGQVAARSKGIGKGSEFLVELPVLPAPAAEPRAPARDAAEKRPSRRVLVVDDNAAAARMLQLLLNQIGGHEVRVAGDGYAALEAAREFQPHVVLLDIGLPRMDGYEVARRLRRQPEFRQTLLIALTGYGQEHDRRRSREAGFDEHLVKPPSLEQLERLLSEVEC